MSNVKAQISKFGIWISFGIWILEFDIMGKGYLQMSKNVVSTSNQRGIALIMVLFVLVFLSVIVMEFCFTIRMEATVTRNFKEGEEAYFCAQAGLNKAIIELMKAKSAVKKAEASKATLVEGEAVQEEEEWRPRDTPYSFSLGDRECEILISDEGGKININTDNVNLLRKLVEDGCGIQGSERDTIVDSILDWRDSDKNHRLNGAEDDYYMSLPEPYHARNENFVVTEELLLVKGVTDEVFYGSGKKGQTSSQSEVKKEDQGETENKLRIGPTKGLSELVTVYSDSDKINVNNAPYDVLMILPGMTSETARKIIDLRAEKELKSGDPRLVADIPNYNLIKDFITFASSPFYNITVTGKVKDSPLKKVLKSVVRIDKGGKGKYEVVYFREGH
jgi:general secretion pathway protein K